MRVFISSKLLVLPLLAALLLVCCNEAPTGPVVGPGNVLKATIGGRPFTFTLNSVIDAPTYEAATKLASFSGTITGDTSRTLRISFTHDIKNGPFPVTLGSTDVSITYVETATGYTGSFSCPISITGCSLTVTGGNGETADGTFNATLANPADTTRQVSITEGSFSVKMMQM